MEYYKIDKTCVMCGTCEEECPVEAISKGENQYVIDPDKCIACGACASRCPVDAIKEAE